MAKAQSVEERLDRLAALRRDPSAPAVRDELARGLSDKTNLVAAKAAALVVEFGRIDLSTELVAAFERFIVQPDKDKGCAVTAAVVQALVDNDERGDAAGARRVFRAGIRHVQMEPAFGGAIDAAAELRGLCALGLVKTGDPSALLELTDLLNDAMPIARAGAARALGYSGQDAAALLLRFKLARPDPESGVIGECLSALIRLSPPWAMEFVGRFLNDPDPSVRATAALALGEGRKFEALWLLRDSFARERDVEVRRPILLAMAMLRVPESVPLLLSLLSNGLLREGPNVLEALKLYRHDLAVRTQVRAAVEARGNVRLMQAFQKAFGD